MTDRYAVIGNPIAHSKSPALHAAFARQCGQDIRYEAILGPLDGFRAAVEAFRQAGGRGMNVTVPFKVEALALADTLTERARLAQASCSSASAATRRSSRGASAALPTTRGWTLRIPGTTPSTISRSGWRRRSRRSAGASAPATRRRGPR